MECKCKTAVFFYRKSNLLPFYYCIAIKTLNAVGGITSLTFQYFRLSY